VSDLDFEDFWADLRARKKPASKDTIQIVGPRASDVGGMLNIVCEKASFELSQKYSALLGGRPLTTEILADLVSTGVRVFMEKWHEGLRGHDLAGLIEIVLEGQSLSPDEMRGFVRALPQSLLQRIASSALGSATGIHGLMAVEFARRQGEVQDYVLRSDSGKVVVEFVNRGGQQASFYLDETFKINESSAPNETLAPPENT
jgi:hypothetical protein